MFVDGRARYDAGDDKGAIVAWTTAYGVAPSGAQRLRFFLAAYLAAAHDRVYKAGGDMEHLRTEQQLLQRYVELYPVEDEDLDLRERNVRLARDRIVAIEKNLVPSTGPAEARVATPTIMNPRQFALLERERMAVDLFVTSAILISTGTLIALTRGSLSAFQNSAPAEVFFAASPGIVAVGTGLFTLEFGIRLRSQARRGVVWSRSRQD